MTTDRINWILSEENSKLLIVMRGVPASGKSYRANELAEGDSSIIFSADHFFGKTPEEYVANWSKEKLGLAHKLCQKNTKMLMQRQKPLVIVDNTNTMIREIMPYFDMAMQYEYRVQIEEPKSSWWVEDIAPYLSDKVANKKHLEKMCQVLWQKNQSTHKVPLKSIEKMLFRYHYDVTTDQLAKIYIRDNT